MFLYGFKDILRPKKITKFWKEIDLVHGKKSENAHFLVNNLDFSIKLFISIEETF